MTPLPSLGPSVDSLVATHGPSCLRASYTLVKTAVGLGILSPLLVEAEIE